MKALQENSRSSANLKSAEEVAKHAAVTSRTVHNWVKDGVISPAYRVGKVIRFDLDEVMKALRNHS